MKKTIAALIAATALSTTAHAGISEHNYDFSFGTAEGQIMWLDVDGEVYGLAANCSYERSLDQDGYWVSHLGSFDGADDTTMIMKFIGYHQYYKNNTNTSDYAMAKLCVAKHMAIYGLTEDDRLADKDDVEGVAELLVIFRNQDTDALEAFATDRGVELVGNNFEDRWDSATGLID